MKKLIRATVREDVLKKFDVDVNSGGHRASKVEAVLAASRKDLKARAKRKPTPTTIISCLVPNEDLELLHKVAEVEGTTVALIVGDLIAKSVK